MIENLPDSQAMNDAALELHFSSWGAVCELRWEFDNYFYQQITQHKTNHPFTEEWNEYVEWAQPNLRIAATLLQQSTELALKAKICEVSPYLLLLSGMRPSDLKAKVDFSELRTLDAVDLPSAVRNLTNNQSSDKFIQKYTSMRKLRNKIAHYGLSIEALDPLMLMRDMLFFYSELWPDRKWLADQVTFRLKGADGYFLNDRRWVSGESLVMSEWPLIDSTITKSMFEKLFGVKKSKRRYFCFDCVEAATTKTFDAAQDGVPTMVANPIDLECLMCELTAKVVDDKCPRCGSTIVSTADNGAFHKCHNCLEELDPP